MVSADVTTTDVATTEVELTLQTLMLLIRYVRTQMSIEVIVMGTLCVYQQEYMCTSAGIHVYISQW